MPVNYGLLKGQVINAIPYKKGTDHYQIELQGGIHIYRIAVDVYSMLAGNKIRFSTTGFAQLDTDRMVMFYKDEAFNHPILEPLITCLPGFTSKADLDTRLHLDYLRVKPALFPLAAMKVVPPKKTGSASVDNLNDDIDPWIQQAKNNPDVDVYAFGSGWDDNAPGAHPDPQTYFNPEPSLGIHDIHMNQGDSGHEAQYNGIGQDGALLLHFNQADRWVAMFFRFQNQRTQTDGQGNPA